MTVTTRGRKSHEGTPRQVDAFERRASNRLRSPPSAGSTAIRSSPRVPRKPTSNNVLDRLFEEDDDLAGRYGRSNAIEDDELPNNSRHRINFNSASSSASSSGTRNKENSQHKAALAKDSTSRLVIQDIFTDEDQDPESDEDDDEYYDDDNNGDTSDENSEDSSGEDGRRHSQRLRKRHRYFLDDEEEAKKDDDFAAIFSDEEEDVVQETRERRRRSNVQSRYNLRTPGKRDPRLERIRSERLRRYNLRPPKNTPGGGEGGMLAVDDKVPWSFVAEYLQAQRDASTPSKGKDSKASDNNSNVNVILASSLAEEEQPVNMPTTSPNENVFARIAGMGDYVRRLKEMIVFPLLYPDLFARMNIAPPRGVLFYGPPGTGKTLLARLLAESCSTRQRKVSFFMRNGSDCLSKWIGEAERNLKLLFQKAKECQPSIIFFDELDGLAPERSGKAEQSHISLVSTLLALMDGLDDRGNVVVIGATNRINALDPALRRPGRFDREFFFPLPDEQVRRDILRVHTGKWPFPPSQQLVDALAKATFGFAGADLKALCTEAAFRSIRRCCPQAYEDDHERALQDLQRVAGDIRVVPEDFASALADMTPSTRRGVNAGESASLSPALSFLYTSQLQQIVRTVRDLFGEPVSTRGDLLGSSVHFLAGNVVRVHVDPDILPMRYGHRIVNAALAELSGINVCRLKHSLTDLDEGYGKAKEAQAQASSSSRPTLLVIEAVDADELALAEAFARDEMVLSEPFALLILLRCEANVECDVLLGPFSDTLLDAFLQEFSQSAGAYLQVPSIEQIEREACRLDIAIDFPLFDYETLVAEAERKPQVQPLLMASTNPTELDCACVAFLKRFLARSSARTSIPRLEQAVNALVRTLTHLVDYPSAANVLAALQ